MTSQAPGNIGPYRLLNVVHTSQTCKIWQAYDDAKQRKVGIKTLRDEYRKNREQIGYLRWEYTVGGKLRHPRLIEVITFDSDRGCPYVAMEWFQAPNMKHWIRQGTEEIAHLLPKVVEQAAEGPGCMHTAGWVHRDVKPDNYLVAENGTVKLIDFALAQRSRRGLSKLFAPKSKVQGTKSYIAPEQIRGSAVDQRADIYSFGCTIHELFAGKPPFTGNSPNELLKKHLKASPPSLEGLNENIAPGFAQLVRSCLAKDPASRPDSFEDFIVALRMNRVFKHPPRPPETAES